MIKTIIKTADLTKVFKTGLLGRKVTALNKLNLEVNNKEIFGFLGPNGAGKTTTIKILMGLIYPTSGKAWLLDKELGNVDVKRKIGFLPEQPYFYDYLTSEEFLKFYGQLAGVHKDSLRDIIPSLLSTVGLEKAKGLQLRKFSKGMLQRIGIAQALINHPDLVVLDEPMSGLDPIGRKEIRELILRLKEEGKTIFFSTHIIPDVELICDRVGILINGELVNVGRLDNIIDTKLKHIEVIASGITKETFDFMHQTDGANVSNFESNDRISIKVQDEHLLERVLGLIKDGKGRVVSVIPHRETLEELFIKKIGGPSS